ncbi:hypothetical protein P43SY_006574 [Pythium insidiosum]|uniref:Palmitoyltransferase DHHC domain-containing protein n=1 Tax=Pythium insidiosum TaxID=114742 RepID=A0AAD5LE84_PYTIN|nr:hypothetical protein P43SY_006574 [Pythium insidiosum]
MLSDAHEHAAPDTRCLVALVRNWRAEKHSSTCSHCGFESSCARSVYVVTDDAQGAGELVRLTDLLSSHAVGRHGLHALCFAEPSRCGLTERCAFCDDADRRAWLHFVGGQPNPAHTFQEMLFEWNPDAASPSFRAVIAEFERLVAASPEASGSCYRPHPVEIEMVLLPVSALATQSLMRRVQEAEQSPGNAGFRITSVVFSGQMMDDDGDLRDWQSLVHSADEMVIPQDPQLSLFATCDIRDLTIELPLASDADLLLLPSLETALSSHGQTLRELTLSVRAASTDIICDAVNELLARAVFSPVSALRLDNVKLDFGSQRNAVAFADEQVERMISIINDADASRDSTQDDSLAYHHRRLTIEQTSWRGVTGETMARLLRAAGGVRELVLSTNNAVDSISAADVAAIVAGVPTLHTLVADISRSDVAPTLEYSQTSSRRTSSVASLGLRFHSLDAAQITEALDGILRVGGERLTTLSIGPCNKQRLGEQVDALLDDAAASLIVARCPQLQRLDVGPIDEGFVTAWTDALRDDTTNWPESEDFEEGTHMENEGMEAAEVELLTRVATVVYESEWLRSVTFSTAMRHDKTALLASIPVRSSAMDRARPSARSRQLAILCRCNTVAISRRRFLFAWASICRRRDRREALPTKMDAEVRITVQDDAARATQEAATGSTTSLTADPSRLALGPVRKNGFEAPYSKDQVIACVGHLVSAACFYIAAGSFLLNRERTASLAIVHLTYVALAIHVPSMILLIASWISCEKIDPCKDVQETLPNGWLGFKLSGPRWEKVRYCAVCRKAVPGLDHHCTWLQTCVGKSNYAQFFTVACTGTIQFLSQAIYASFCLVWVELPVDSVGQTSVVSQGLLAACVIISIPCTMMYFILLGFHVHLYFLGYGTYEWMLRRRREQRAKAAAAQASKEASSTETTTTRVPLSRPAQPEQTAGPREARHHSSVGSANGDFVSADEDDSPSETSSTTSTVRELTAL